MILGRDSERAAIRETLAGGAALVLRGELGAGKTTLLRDAVATCGDARVLYAGGAEGERDLPFAALHQLLLPLLARIDTIPTNQASALALLASAAQERRVVCVVDDAHLVDDASLAALTFAARRPQPGLAFLFAAADHAPDPFAGSGLPGLELGGLDHDDAAEVLEAAVGTRTAAETREAILRAARGNPLAVCALARALSPAQLAGDARLPDLLPPTSYAAHVLEPRLRDLSGEARAMLLLAAADSVAEAAVVLDAGLQLGLLPTALEELEAASLVHAGRRIELRPPLLRSVAYYAAPLAHRQAAHRALASVLGAPRHADLRVRHRAAATPGADEEVALELTVVAADARGRGSHADAADALELAAELTADATVRAERLADAADSAWVAGASRERVCALVRRASLLSSAQVVRVRIAHVRARLELHAGRPEVALTMLLDTAGPLVEAEAAALITNDRSRLPGMTLHLPAWQRSLHRGFVALEQLETTAAIEAFDSAVRALRDSGANGQLPSALQWLAIAELTTGGFTAAHEHATEGLRLAEEAGQPNPAVHHRAVLAAVAAADGDEERCRSLAGEVVREAASRGLALAEDLATSALGELELALGRPEQAAATLRRLGSSFAGVLATPSLVEAAVRSDDREAAESATASLQASLLQTPRGQALLARCRAVLDETELDIASSTTFDYARLRLLQGETLRRNRRRREARLHLREALDAFERVGATAWARRAEAELRGSGMTAQRGDAARIDQLTPQELQVAQLVADGASNKDVAARLFLSPRTIDFHLRNVFAKLGITSRAQLVWFGLHGDFAGAKDREAA